MSRPIGRIVLALVAVVAALVLLRVVIDRADPDPALIGGAGTLTIGDTTYAFTPTACFISDEDFVAAGTGFDGDDRFWVSASSVSLDLAVGTKTEIDQPADDQLWLNANENVDWTATGQTVVARAPMADRRSPGSTTVMGSLELRCDG